MKDLIKTLIASLAIITSLAAKADDVQLGIPQYGGTGCPANTASVAISPDSKSLSILFDQYVVEAGGTTGQSFGRKNCNIAIPVHVPQGFSFAVVALDYRGFMALPAGGRAQLNVNYFLADDPHSVRTSKTFMGPQASDYLKSDSLGLESIVWTPCGADTILRANTTMLVQTNSRREQAMGTVDSVDASAGIIYQLQWKQCN